MSLQHFHPVVREWFLRRIGAPSPPQAEGWPKIQSGRHTLIAAPTGTGKTLAAFLWAVDGLPRRWLRLQP
jgi:ATP-dependent Lhr-like helicase